MPRHCPSTLYRLAVLPLTALLAAGFGEGAAAGDAVPAPVQPPVLTTRNFVVELTAAVDTRPAIVLHWTAPMPATGYRVSRRLMGECVWPAPVALPGDALQHTDLAVTKGTLYEYRVERVCGDHIARGYVCSGIEVPAVEERGRLLLLTEKTIAAALPFELERLTLDLIGDGWSVTRLEVARDERVTAVKELIRTEYQKDPQHTCALFIVGHVPVPYSGDIMPDGHSDHRGAWPADVYYADMTGEWTDRADIDAAKPVPPEWNQLARRLRNVAGDGKFDQSWPPGPVVLQTGRVDLSNMPAFSLDEIALLRRYLDKDHGFRHAYATFKPQGLVDDNFGFFNGESFGSSGWRNLAPCLGPAAVTDTDWFTGLGADSYLWAYGAGGGCMTGAGGVGTTADFAAKNIQAAFTMLFGSIFGDWDGTDNFLRAPLAAGNGLTCGWAGRPHWYLHPMAMGLPIGYSCLRAQGNQPGDYQHSELTQRKHDDKDGGDQDTQSNLIHVALMGDPTLRLQPVPPVRRLGAEDNGKWLAWDAPADTERIGYHVYRAAALTGPYTRLTPEPILETRYQDPAGAAGKAYMVRVLKHQTSPSGSYLNLSQGVFLQVPVDGVSKRTAHELKAQELKTRGDRPISGKLTGLSAGKRAVVSVATQPRHGTVSVKGTKFTYTPTPYFHGTDDFMLVASDGVADRDHAKVTVTVARVKYAPTALGQTLCLTDETARLITLTGKDVEGRPLTFAIAKPPRHGTLTGTAPALTYTPTPGARLPDEIAFKADNGELRSAPATITIQPPNVCPKGAPLTVDGDLSDWPALPYTCTKPRQFGFNPAAWKGPKDSSFSFGVRHDDTHLYIAVKVIDDAIFATKGPDPWQQDGVEIRLDGRPRAVCAAARGDGETTNFLLIAMSPSLAAADPWVHQPDKLPAGTRYACVRNTTGYAAEVAVPLSYLKEKAGGDWWGFRLNIQVDDCDADGITQICWYPDWRSGEAVPGSGIFLRP